LHLISVPIFARPHQLPSPEFIPSPDGKCQQLPSGECRDELARDNPEVSVRSRGTIVAGRSAGLARDLIETGLS
jgi:hypothetical protein